MFRAHGPSWHALKAQWPHSEVSRFVSAGGMRWHVQEMGEGPVLLLVHGAGASTHSWAGMMAELAKVFRVVAIDLPGHAFSDTPRGYRPTIEQVCGLLAKLITALELDVCYAVGHSAGAAILSNMILKGRLKPGALVSINGAFQPFDGVAGHVFPALAKLMVLNPLTPRALALSARSFKRVEKVITGTGSTISREGLLQYQHLVMTPGHIAGVLGMMAHWDLDQLSRDLPNLETPFLVIAGEKDRAVPPSIAGEVAEHVASAQLELWPGLGHLAHEEAPERTAQRLISFACEQGILDSDPASDNNSDYTTGLGVTT